MLEVLEEPFVWYEEPLVIEPDNTIRSTTSENESQYVPPTVSHVTNERPSPIGETATVVSGLKTRDEGNRD